MDSYEWTHRTAEEKLDLKAEGDRLLFLAAGKWLRGNHLGDEAAREILRLSEENAELRGKMQLLAESGAAAAQLASRLAFRLNRKEDER